MLSIPLTKIQLKYHRSITLFRTIDNDFGSNITLQRLTQLK